MKLTLSNRLSRLLSLLVLLALVVAALPQPAQAASEGASLSATCSEYHRVRSGQTLKKIAKMYNISWQSLAEANDVVSPYTLTTGQRLCIPAAKAANSRDTGTASFEVLVTRSKDVKVILHDSSKVNTYIVRVGPNIPNNRIWVKVGKMSSSKSKNVEKLFDLPARFHDNGSIMVCLKNATTDAVSCRTAVVR